MNVSRQPAPLDGDPTDDLVTDTAPAIPAPRRGPLPAPLSGHLDQVDVTRILTFTGVVAVHALAHTTPATTIPAGMAAMLLHFTREVFFVITGFVLVHSYGRRPLRLGPFYRRRFLLIGLPYLAWTLIYLEAHYTGVHTTGPWLAQFGYCLLTGAACYHLYFLLVSMQIYLLTPLLLAGLRRTRGHHGLLFAGAVVFQLVAFWLLQSHPAVPGGWGVLAKHTDVLFPSYLVYLVAGALAATHLGRWQPWADTHRPHLAGLLGVGVAIALGAFVAQVHGPADVVHAENVLQPAMVPYSLAVAAALYAFGSWWAARRRAARAAGRSPSRMEAVVRVASHASFGIYLTHPLILQFFSNEWLGLPSPALPHLPGTVLLVVLTIAVTTPVVLLLERTPLSLLLTGRERLT